MEASEASSPHASKQLLLWWALKLTGYDLGQHAQARSPTRRGEGSCKDGGGSPIEKGQVCLLYLLEAEQVVLVPFRAFNLKRSTARVNITRDISKSTDC